MDDLLKEMGKRIHDRRKQLHMTQERLAELAGITPQTVSTAELGQKARGPIQLSISTALEVSTDYLLLGKVTGDDQLLLSPKVSELTPIQYRHLETIIESFVAAVKEKETQEN
ncbi:MAG: helix-turn-helix domain-containing protein [Enterocloster sp.]|uniref:helix-turn-helix domain-containing protein n=1 Tax=Enterocloster sp. TaxID=2719315 RepID=UPI003995D4F3